MNESIQNTQVRTMIAKAAEERDEARATAITLEAMWRKERKWNRIFSLLIIALTLALILVQ